jgi:hypothetical protein
LRLNPSLTDAVAPWRMKTVRPMDRLGQDNPPIDRAARRFLRRFCQPVTVADLTPLERQEMEQFVAAWYLVATSD